MQRLRISRRGLMLVLSSPSGAGKTTISRELLARDAGLHMSVSVTTRLPRPGERDGVDYSFIGTDDFGLMVNRRELLEHAKVFDHYYGTPAAAVEVALGEAQLEAGQLLAQARERAEVRQRDIVETAKREADAMIESARTTIRAEQEKAVSAIRNEVVDLSLSAASQVLGRAVDSSDDWRLANELVSAAEQPGGD